MRDDAQKDVPLLLLCAEDSEVTLVQLVDALNRAGRSPEVVAGVEHDTSLLSSATDRMRGAALFVLCQSEELDRSQVLRLTGLFSARKGPQHQLLVVELDDAQPLQSLPLIEATMESVARTAPVDHAEGDARVPRRDVVVMSGESSTRNSIPNFDDPHGDDPRVLELREAEALARDREARAREEAAQRQREEEARRARAEAERKAREDAERKTREDAETFARTFHEEIVAAEAVLERRKPGRRVPSPDPRVEDDLPTPERLLEEPGVVEQPLELDRPALDTKAHDVDAESTPEPIDELSRDSADQIGTLSNSLAGVRVAEPLAGLSLPDSLPTELTPTDTRRHREPADELPPPPSKLDRAESRRGWLLATLGAVALGGVALFAVREPEQPAIRDAPANASTGPVNAKTKSAPDVGGGASPTEPKPEPAPGERDTAEPEALEEPAVAKSQTPPAEPPLAPTRVPPPPVDSEALKVDDAIRSGKVRAIDSLLIATAGADTVDWTQAKSACRRKRVAGLPGWRLPSRHQLARLRRSRIIDSGTYWSREKGPHDDDAYAFDAKSGAENLYLQEEPAARVQCVRKR